MTTMTTETQPDYVKAREELIALYSAKCPQGQVVRIGQMKDESGWQHTLWNVLIAGQVLEYRTGTCIKKAPEAAEVLACYCREGMDADCSFANWCADTGDDTDSISSLKTYLACQANGEKALAILKDRALVRQFAELSARL